jgi:hypothetical protein
VFVIGAMSANFTSVPPKNQAAESVCIFLFLVATIAPTR